MLPPSSGWNETLIFYHIATHCHNPEGYNFGQYLWLDLICGGMVLTL
jgi:hypothetical protein